MTHQSSSTEAERFFGLLPHELMKQREVKIRFIHIVSDQNFTSEVLKNMANVKGAVDERAVYTPPRVVKMSDLNPGYGQVSQCASGSGDGGPCKPGNMAGNGCYAGNAAAPF